MGPDHRPMAGHPPRVHAAPMVEFIVLACTALAFFAIVAAVPLELTEARRDESDPH